MTITKNAIFASALTVISLALYGISLFLPTFISVSMRYPESGSGIFLHGSDTLFLGWLGICYGQFGWFCNFLFPALFILAWTRQWRGLIFLAGIATLLAVLSNCIGMIVDADESGSSKERIVGVGSGYYFWVASFAVWLFAFLPYKLQLLDNIDNHVSER